MQLTKKLALALATFVVFIPFVYAEDSTPQTLECEAYSVLGIRPGMSVDLALQMIPELTRSEPVIPLYDLPALCATRRLDPETEGQLCVFQVDEQVACVQFVQNASTLNLRMQAVFRKLHLLQASDGDAYERCGIRESRAVSGGVLCSEEVLRRLERSR